MNYKTAIFFLLTLCIGCSKNALFDAGETTTKVILLPNKFLNIKSQSIFDLELVQDTVNKIYITCGNNLQKFVSVTIVGDTLILEQHTKNNWSRAYNRIKLEYHTNQDFNINSKAPLHLTSSDTLRMNNFVFLDWTILSEVDVKLNVINCTLVNSPGHFGDIRASGKCISLFLWNRGSCIFHTDQLASSSASIIQQGQGDMYVNIINQLTVSLENSGNVYYADKNPQIIIQKQSSTGRLIKQN